MASLTGQSIDTTYQGLLTTFSNGALPVATPGQTITDGIGNQSPLILSQQDFEVYALGSIYIQDQNSNNGITIDATSTRPQGSWDFASASVTGLPGGGGTPEFLPFWTASGALTTTGEINFFTSFATPIYLKQGQILEEWTSSISTAYSAGATFNVYLYNSQRRDTPSANGYVYPYQNVHTIGTSIAADVTGQVTVNMVDYTVPKTGVYYVYWTVTTDSGYWHKCNFSFSSGNAFQYTTGLSNQYNQNVSAAGRHWFSGASAGAPATLPSNGTGINDMSPDPWYIFKINS